MPQEQINLRLDPELIEQVDTARGDVPRNRWIVRAVERALSGADEEPRSSGAASDRVAAAPAEQPKRSKPVSRSKSPGAFGPPPGGARSPQKGSQGARGTVSRRVHAETCTCAVCRS